MGDMLVKSESLAAVADTIRTKGGTSGALTFPGGFIDAVEAIQAGGGGGEEELLLSLCENTFAELNNSNITIIKTQAFKTITAIKKVILPNCQTFTLDCFNQNSGIRELYLENYTGVSDSSTQSAFANNTSMVKAWMPKCTKIPTRMFNGCSALSEVIVSDNLTSIGLAGLKATAITEFIHPNVNDIGNNAFEGCYKLATVDVMGASTLGNATFLNARALETLILRRSTLVPLQGTGCFSGSPLGGYGGTYSGHVYVKASLITEYQQATNWSTLYANYPDIFRAIEGSEYE